MFVSHKLSREIGNRDVNSFLDRTLICGKIFEEQVSWSFTVGRRYRSFLRMSDSKRGMVQDPKEVELVYCFLQDIYISRRGLNLMYIWHILCHFLFNKILLGLSKTIICLEMFSLYTSFYFNIFGFLIFIVERDSNSLKK